MSLKLIQMYRNVEADLGEADLLFARRRKERMRVLPGAPMTKHNVSIRPKMMSVYGRVVEVELVVSFIAK